MNRRYATILLATVALGSLAGCSLLELGDFGLDGCERPEQCDVLNERDGLDDGSCMIWQCRADKRGCEQRPRDLDGDQHPDANACTMLDVPLDCADRDAQRAEGLRESADQRDNDCDGWIDEDAPPEAVRESVVDSLRAPGFASYGQGDGEALYLLAGTKTMGAQAWVLSGDEPSAARDVVYGFAGSRAPGCQNPAHLANQAGLCDFAELSLAAVSDELLAAGVNLTGCGWGQLRVGVGRAGDFVFRAAAAHGVSNVEWGADLEAVVGEGDPCTVVDGKRGARSPRIAALPATGGLESSHALALWLTASGGSPDCADEVDVVALGLWPHGARDARWLEGGRGGHGEVIGRSAGCAPPSVAALRAGEDAGYAVAIAGSDAIELLWLAKPSTPDTSLASNARRTALPAAAPGQVVLAVVPEAAGARGWLVAWRSSERPGELGFAPLHASTAGLRADEPQRVERDAEITAGPVAAYALSGFALPTPDASASTGGWLIAWSERDADGARLMAVRVADLSGELGSARILGEPFELSESDARFPFVRPAPDAGFDYGFVAVQGTSGELTRGRL